jgi:O-antigen/teichoic acid export membrane protein
MYTRSKTIFIKGMNSKFMERSRIVFLGVIVSQLITFATSFVITGYYDPEDLGLLGTIGALISIIAGTLSFRLDVAVIQAKEEDATDVFLRSTLLGMLACTIFSLICLILPWDFAKKVSDFFIPFVLWCWGYCLFFNSKQLPFKFNHLNNVSYGVIWKSAFTFVFQLIGGILKPSFGLLLTGRVSGDYVGALAHCWKYLKDFDLKRLKTGWNKFLSTHADFLFYMTPHHLCIALSNNIVIFFLDKSYGLAIVGFFALAQRLIQAPLELIGSTLFNVTIQRFGELQHNIQELRRFYTKVIFFSFAVSIVIGLGIWGTIDFFIPILGAKWAPAAPMVKNLIPYFMSTIFVTPTTNFLRFVNKAKLQLGVEIVEVAIKIGFLSMVVFSGSTEMILGYSLLAFGLGILKTGLVFRLIAKLK